MTADTAAAEPTAAEPTVPEARAPEAKPARSLGPLRMIWKAALAYPSVVAIAAFALLVTASATAAK